MKKYRLTVSNDDRLLTSTKCRGRMELVRSVVDAVTFYRTDHLHVEIEREK